MLGTWLKCSFTLYLWVSGLGRSVPQQVELRCKVEEEFMPVGTPDLRYTPLFVDCSEDAKVVAPQEPYGKFLVYKERDCEI